jgi:hypothetical protein
VYFYHFQLTLFALSTLAPNESRFTLNLRFANESRYGDTVSTSEPDSQHPNYYFEVAKICQGLPAQPVSIADRPAIGQQPAREAGDGRCNGLAKPSGFASLPCSGIGPPLDDCCRERTWLLHTCS